MYLIYLFPPKSHSTLSCAEKMMKNVCHIKHSPWFDSYQNIGVQKYTVNSEKPNLVYFDFKFFKAL